MTIDIYTTPQCGFCRQLKALLDAEDREYTAHDVTTSKEVLQEMQTLSDGAMSVPVLVLNKGEDTQQVSVGFEEAKKLLGKEAKTSKKENNRQTTILTCPECGHRQHGIIPTTSCVPFYACDGCKKIIRAEGEDCCVFCSYGDRPCPLKKPRGGSCEGGTCTPRPPKRA